MNKNPDLIISGLKRQLLKQDEQIQHNALYFLNKLKSSENQHKRNMDVMLFLFNNHALRIKELEKQIEKRVVLGYGEYAVFSGFFSEWAKWANPAPLFHKYLLYTSL